MARGSGSVLPYRVDGPGLARLVEARAEGVELSRIEAQDPSVRRFNGRVRAARALGLLASREAEPTERGRRFARGDRDDKQRVLVEAMRDYEPYARLLDAVLGDGPSATSLPTIEHWWREQGYGSSATNRGEAAIAFARLAEYAGLGAFIPGRGGRDSRVEWTEDAPARVRATPEPVAADGAAAPVDRYAELLDGLATLPDGAGDVPAPRIASRLHDRTLELVLPLGPGRVVELHAPAGLSGEERGRVLGLLEAVM